MLKIRHFADGADVTVTTYDLVAGFQPGQKKDSVGKIVNTFLLNSLALVGRANMDSKREYIKELEFKIQNAKTDVEDEKEKLVSHYNAKIKALEEKVYYFHSYINNLKPSNRIETLFTNIRRCLRRLWKKLITDRKRY